MNKGQKPYLLHSSPYQETQNDFYFSLILRFCNFYSIKMINKSIKLETKTIIESVSSGTPRPIISRGCACVFAPTQRGWDSVLLTGHTLFSEGNKLPFPGSRKALKAWATFKPGWWESSRQGPGSSLDKHSQGTCFRYPCQTALPHLLRGIKNHKWVLKVSYYTPHILLKKQPSAVLQKHDSLDFTLMTITGTNFCYQRHKSTFHNLLSVQLLPQLTQFARMPTWAAMIYSWDTASLEESQPSWHPACSLHFSLPENPVSH